MRNLCWICWFFWESFSTLVAHPASPIILTGSDDSWHREFYWLKYAFGIFGITITAFTLIGCLCCNRNQRSKGFQEFQDERAVDHESALQHSFVGLELEVPQSVNISSQIQFDPIPAENFSCKNYVTNKPKLPSPPSVFEEEAGETIHDSCREWCNATNLHLSREKLKYLREIGQGWFGKVVEGRADLEDLKINEKIGNVVVRILSDEATAKEKAWFLVEATPYFKLSHRNILALIGCCLETDPYLLIFESCPFGDLKSFLRSNHDSRSRCVLSRENMLTRMALDIGAGLQHMHDNGFAHTDLSARNCLVSTDLSVKLGDYGVGVEKYPLDYYVIGDRALPIRWSAPESLECSETTIETREITPCANIWSYAVLLWELITWGERPYDELDDEQVIQMLLSKSGLKSTSSQLLLQRFEKSSCNILEVINLCLDVDTSKRTSLEQATTMLIKDHSTVEDFEHRWENLQPNTSNGRARSASLKDLRGSVDSESWPTLIEDKLLSKHQAKFQLGPQESVNNIPGSHPKIPFRESDSETEEESWKVKVERGAYTEKVKLKSKSVTDLMVLVHIDSDSDVDWSLGPQITEKSVKKKLTLFGSDSDLRSKTLASEFDQELKKMRDTSNSSKITKSNIDQGKTLDLNLSLDSDKSLDSELHQELTKTEKCVLRLTSKIDPSSSFSNHVPEHCATVKFEKLLESPNVSTNNDNTNIRNNYSIKNVNNVQSELVDVVLKNKVLDSALEMNVFDSEMGENASMPLTSNSSLNHSILELENCKDHKSKNDMSVLENVETGIKQNPSVEEEEILKNLLKPDDERSSDSGFKDKESCDEEESPRLRQDLEASSNKVDEHTDEEQLRILFELDSILDAECYGSLSDPLNYNTTSTTPKKFDELVEIGENCDYYNVVDVAENEMKTNKDHGRDERTLVERALSDAEDKILYTKAEGTVKNIDVEMSKENTLTIANKPYSDCVSTSSLEKEYWIEKDENEEDNSTISSHSNNSYVSFSLDEEFVAAIRNELREKLPHTQMAVIEFPELQNVDEQSISSDKDCNRWDYDDVQDSTDCTSGVDISIRYNMYDTPLSPIFEERESNFNSESLISREGSKDTSLASKDSIPEEDLLLMDTSARKIKAVEGKDEFSHENVTQMNHLEVMNDVTTNQQINDFGGVSYCLRSGEVITHKGVPLPSPEEESQWKQHPCSLGLSLPVQLEIQGDLMSTSFVVENNSDSQEEEDLEEDEEDDADIDNQADDEDNSSSSGEFVYEQYSKPNHSTSDADIQNLVNQVEKERMQIEEGNQVVSEDNDENDDVDEGDVEDEEEFTPSAWDANLAPHRSALRSPDKTLKSTDQKKNVWFKKQRYHCVYEYPKEASTCDKEDQVSAQWEPTTYADWEEMISEPRLDLHSLDDESTSRDEEFCISSSNRPFQFETGDGTYVSQFFPGAGAEDPYQFQTQDNHQIQQKPNKEKEDEQEGQQSRQLGELRHTRDRLKLNLTTSNEIAETTVCSTNVKQSNNNISNINEKQSFTVEEKCNDNPLQPADSPKLNE